MASSNAFDPEFDGINERQGFNSRRAKLGEQAGSQRLGASLYELAPGSAAFPLHYHLGNEELLIVISGTPSLRTPDGERRLEAGEVVAFHVGPDGAHQLINRDGGPVRILIVSEMNSPDVVVRPESGKLSAFGRPPGSSEEGMHEVFFLRDSGDLWDAESPPPPPPGQSG